MADPHFRYLSGVPHPLMMGWWKYGGIMFTPEMGNRLDLRGVVWSADNGCFTAGDRFDPAKWLAFLDANERYWPTCQFAVLPDVPFNAEATWERSRPFLAEIRARGLRPALAIQEGISRIGVPWKEIGAVFIAGRDHQFKTGQIAQGIVHEARRRNMPAHYARGNSGKAVQNAYDMGCTSIDGTFLRFAPDINTRRMQGWWDHLCRHARAVAWGSDARYAICQDCRRPIWREVKAIA